MIGWLLLVGSVLCGSLVGRWWAPVVPLVLSAIVYLNEEFEGGLTRFADGAEVKPETGKAVLFRGKDFWHEVTDVAGGARYTVSLWWSNDPRRLEP